MGRSSGRGARRTPPGPIGYPVVGSLPAWGRDPLRFFSAVAERYGDVARFRLASWTVTLLSNPEHIRYVLQEHNQNYEKNKPTFFMRRLKPLLGEGLATTNGPQWLRLRRMVQPAFHRQRIASFASVMTEATSAAIEAWRPTAAAGRPIELDGELRRLTLEILVRTLTPLRDERLRADSETVRDLLHDWVRRTRRVSTLLGLLLPLPTPGRRRFEAAIATLDRVIYRLIAERRRAGADGDDLLSLLLSARDAETGEGLTDLEIRDQVATIFSAGFETTATALSFAFALLAQHPAAQQRLRDEVTAVLGERTPTIADLPRLPYARMVFEEAMRLYPPNWALRRIPIADDEIGGYHIPAGSTVIMSPWVVHRHSAFWSNPETFDPERFAPERADDRPRLAYFPFGAGPRQCIGNNFALVEGQLIVAMIVQHYRLRLAPGQALDPQPSIPLRPRDGLLFYLEAIPPAGEATTASPLGTAPTAVGAADVRRPPGD